MTNRNKNLQFAYTPAIGVVLLLAPSRAVATNDENHIQEIMAGVNGNSKIRKPLIYGRSPSLLATTLASAGGSP